MVGKEQKNVCKVGPVELAVTSAELAAFDAATRFHDGAAYNRSRADVPLSFLPTLLGHPSVKPMVVEALQRLAGDAAANFIHVQQDVVVHGKVAPDHRYNFAITCRCDAADNIQIAGELSEFGTAVVAVMQSKLLVVRAGDLA